MHNDNINYRILIFCYPLPIDRVPIKFIVGYKL